ncbi:putative sulfate exporter family transporter [Bradyrhizobium sp. 192]|uniref:YeiH family protein n=1 Tax=Bradyrhizobium sp. 192 TaxID=2782660 RepID=UPI001FFF0174|nr:putative sulfate exporter family transporter [Bradyrhizobium sp. 192]UPJ61191.1 putative sulfate exporter family transporter [Bradyrhizobium sp. 192]
MSQNQASSPADAKPATAASRIFGLIPGILLCIAVAGVSALLERAELGVFEHPYVEALVMAILLGMALRSFWKPAPRWQAGIAFSAKQLLEVAVMLLGASISFAAIAASGVALLASIAAVVVIALCVSFGLSRMLGLSTRLSILIACGNSICGNSAIAAVAPIIGATNDEIASSISFTAILGVMMVLGLPLLIPLLQLSATQYGILAGLTVYAVPQVLAATVPAGLVSTQIGTLVKLMRVLMLGPVVVGLSLAASRWQSDAKKTNVSFFRLVPWFILGFLALATLRSLEIVPGTVVGPVTKITSFLTVVSMAALGLGVDVRVLANVGGRVTAAVTLSLMLLLGISIALVHWFK